MLPILSVLLLIDKSPSVWFNAAPPMARIEVLLTVTGPVPSTVLVATAGTRATVAPASVVPPE